VKRAAPIAAISCLLLVAGLVAASGVPAASSEHTVRVYSGSDRSVALFISAKCHLSRRRDVFYAESKSTDGRSEMKVVLADFTGFHHYQLEQNLDATAWVNFDDRPSGYYSSQYPPPYPSPGGGAVKFVKDYAAAGLMKSMPLYGPGFLTDGTLEAQGEAAQGMYTTLHYADNLNTPRDNAFRLAFAKAYKVNADVYAVQGYDAAQMLGAGLKAAGGDIKNRDKLVAGMEAAQVDSPRGKFKLSSAHNPVQDIYLRQVKGNVNEVKGVAVKALADPAKGCKM